MRFFWSFGLILLVGCANELEIANSDTFDANRLNLVEQEASTFSPSPLLQTYENCESLAADIKAAALSEMHAGIARKLKEGPSSFIYPPRTTMGPMPAPTSAGAAEAMPASEMKEGIDFSGTNNQENGVDEADVIKTDGQFFYVLHQSKLEILSIDEGKILPKSQVSLENPGHSLLLLDDKAYVFSTSYEKVMNNTPEGFWSSVLRVDEIDLSSDRLSPKIIDTYYFQGDFIGARRVDGKIHISTHSQNSIDFNYYPNLGMDFYQLSSEEQLLLWGEALLALERENEEKIRTMDFQDILPNRLIKENHQLKAVAISQKDCAKTFSPKDSYSNGFLSIYTLDGQPEISGQWVRGNKPILYASKDQLILASSEYPEWRFNEDEDLKEQTTIHKFKLSGNSPTYLDSTRVLGTLHNSFSISEYQGYLRLATTTGRRFFWRNTPEENHLYVLADTGNLAVISSLHNIAPGEKIWAARFSKDKAFLVTFKQVDPLFTIDLSDPKNPQVVGELKVPGVSTYLADIGQDQLLAVGFGGDEAGLDFKPTISLFDVSDFKKPKLAHSLPLVSAKLDAAWNTSSEANETHLAINYFAPLGLTAIPLSAYKLGEPYEYMSKLVLVSTVPGQDLVVHGEVDHSPFYKVKDGGYGYDKTQIFRSYFVSDYIYAISPTIITATKLSDMKTTDVYKLE